MRGRRALRIGLGAILLLAAAVACQSHRHGQGAALGPPPAGALRLASYNVHYILAREAEGRWGLAGWERRKEPLAKTVGALGADIIAFQEMETFSGGNDDAMNLARDFLLARHPQYAVAAVGDWRTFPSTQPIFYLERRLALRDQGWFFFSDTPDIIYSRTFNGSYPAFASWATFEERATGATFRVVNLHTDYASRENRRRSIDLVAARIGPWVSAGERVFLAGDLNARAGSELHRRLEAAGLRFVPVPGATYHLDRGLNLFGAIDHIAHAGVRPEGAAVVVRERFGPVWPTDHYPVVADFHLAE